MKFKIIQELKHEFLSLKSLYPEFVYSDKLKKIKDQIPIFVFHTISPNIFEEQLKYILKNNYNTLSINEYYNIIIGKSRFKENSILLTCDDGRLSFWQYAFPLLKKYNLKATLFIIPGITEESKNLRKNLENVWKKEISNSSLLQINQDDRLFCNWKELKNMYDSNLIDIESHTLMHKVVFTDTKVIGFVNAKTHSSIFATYQELDNISINFNPEQYYGFPIYEHEPFLKGNRNYFVHQKVIDASCLSKNKNEESSKIRIQELSKKNNKLKTFEEVETEILNDLSESRNIIKKKINSRAGDHLCLPWTIGTEKTIELSKKVGYKAVYWGVRKDKRINSINDNPYYSCRIKNDFIYRLPGRGRKSLFKIYINKILRRFSGVTGY